MAQLNVRDGGGGIWWQITGLAELFNTDKYKKAVVTTMNFGAEVSDDNFVDHYVVDSEAAGSPSGSDTRSAPRTERFCSLEPGSYRFYGYARPAEIGIWYRTTPASGVQVTVTRKPPPTYKVKASISFDANGGAGAPASVSGEATLTSEYGNVSITFPSSVPTRAGYKFSHWLLRSGEIWYVTPYYPGGTYSIHGASSGVTYTAYAQWEEIKTGITPLIWDGSGKWRPGKLLVWDGGWKEVKVNIYGGSNGWYPK